VGEIPKDHVKTSDFDYELPRELIAQYPAERRDESRLLVVRRRGGPVEHRGFPDVLGYLRAGDLLVLNESRVIPARLRGAKRGSGGRVEVFLLRELRPGRWETLVKPGARIGEGAVLEFGGGELEARVMGVLPAGKREVEFSADGDLASVLERLGQVPLPPYIEREPDESDRERYQTVYATVPGAVAAPTAGLHFTESLLDRAGANGIGIARVVLHVGLGTFRPVVVEEPGEHEMEEERYDVSPEAADAINRTRAAGGRIVAVGTTSVRVLESVADAAGRMRAGAGVTRLFIRPPHEFRCTDALITNFHLPRSTLLMLVSAFAGRENVLAAYREAVRARYRFYSYGDAMLIL
jgi:S-adenosylmethionine:tRNA ribosyltransferase-isomerase